MKSNVDPRTLMPLALVVLALTGCGSSARHSSSPAAAPAAGPAAASTAQPAPALAPAVSELPAAEHPSSRLFPPSRGRTLQQLAAIARSSVQLGPATGVFTPGRGRFAFALNASSGAFVYAPTALYIARRPGSPAQGPFLAPADPMTVAPQYRSRQNQGPGRIQAIYEAQLPLPPAGSYAVLALTRTARGWIGAAGEIAVAVSSPIPDVGRRPPAIDTDTPASTHGNVALLTTRIPPDDMHAVSFKDALGKRPVALLFSTPQLCTSRVCGPVTDIVAELEHQFGHRIAFIHEEVYADNQPTKGFRPQFKAFHLQSEPWLFTVDRRGRIVARLEGSFGVNAAAGALQAALR
jgi:hypothetical protein